MTGGITRDPSYFEYPQSRLKTFASALGLVAEPAGVELLDISENQSRDIVKYFPALIADGYGGIVIRATNGMTKDKSFDYFYPAALDAGFVVEVYGAMYGSRSGKDQANFLIDTAAGLITAVGGNTVAWSDGETPDGVPISTHRTVQLDWLSTVKQAVKKAGAYGSIKTWQEFYGNLTLPLEFYFWNAQWRSGSVFTIPAGIRPEQVAMVQNGVWPNYVWIAQPDNLPRAEDVDHNFMPGKTLQDLKNFTGQLIVVPPPPPPPEPIPVHTHNDLLLMIQATSTKTEANTAAIQQLQLSVLDKLRIPAEVWKVKGTNAPARFAKSWNDAEIDRGGPKLVLEIFPGDGSSQSERIFLSGDVTIFPLQFVGNGNERFYPVLDQKWYDKTPPGIFLYVRAEDIEPKR